MALQNGCTGQELINFINELDSRTEQHIGDILCTYRKDLGDKYLLCNGDVITSNDGYGDLVDLCHQQGEKWYQTYPVDYQKKGYPVLYDGAIYTVRVTLNTSPFSFVLQKYNSMDDYASGTMAWEKTMWTYTSSSSASSYSIVNACICKGRIYVSAYINDDYYYVLSDTITESSDCKVTGGSGSGGADSRYWHMGTDGENVYIARIPSSQAKYILFSKNKDDGSFESEQVSIGISCGSIIDINVINGRVYILIDAYVDSDGMAIAHIDTSLSGEWVISKSSIYPVCSNIGYYDGYFWIFDGKKIYQSIGTPSTWNPVYEVSDGQNSLHANFIKRDVDFCCVCSNSGDDSLLFLYDELNKNFIKSNDRMDFINNNLVNTSDGFHLENFGAQEDYGSYLLCCKYVIPKQYSLSFLPMISPDMGFAYAYIKAKE